MSSGRDGAPSDSEDSGGLPPQAPAYDFRTGQPLQEPTDPYAAGSADDDLGIWAPGGSESETAEPPTRLTGYDAYGKPGAGAAYTPPPSGPYEDSSYEQSGYGQPGYGQPGYTEPQYGSIGYSQPSYTSPAGSQSGVPTQVPSPTGPGQASYPGYGAPGTSPTLTGSGPGPGPDRSRRGLAILGGVVGVLAVVVAVLVTVLLVGGSSDEEEPVSSPGSAAPGTPGGGDPSGSTNGGTAGSTSGTGSNAARATFVRTVEGILNQSASGRSQVASAVNGVTNGCSVSPASAASSMQSVIDNRESVLAQASALSPPDAATAAVKNNLVRALEASIEANRGYLQWFEDLQAEYPGASPAGCPNGTAPTNISYDEATAASGRATAAKQSFVAAYNPLASAAGQRSWSESEF